MTDINYDWILQSFLLLNLKIEERFFKQTAFLDKEIEAQYIRERYKNSKKKKIYTDVFLIFCYITIIIYIYMHKYDNFFAYVCMGCLGMGLILIAFSYLIQNYNFDLLVNHVMVLLLGIFLSFKVMYLACHKNTPDYDGEIIRTLIYGFVISNIMTYVTLDTRLPVSVFLFIINLIASIVAQINSNQNYYYYFEAIIGLAITVFLYLLKKEWEASDRANFAEKFRFQKFYYYTRDFIKGLNGYYLNVSKDLSLSCDSKMKALLNEMQIDRFTGKSRNSEKSRDIIDISEVSKNEINSLMVINPSVNEQNFGNLSLEVLKLFKLYNEDDGTNENSNGEKENLAAKLKELMLEPSTENFISVGQFKVKSFVCTKYFAVYFRKFSLGENCSVNDILMNDVTELITSRQKIYEEGIIKEKIMAKIMHEFKTPINSIIGVIGNIEDSINSTNPQQIKTTMKHLDTIRNLSRYVIFLISDIIHFTNIKSLEEIKIIPQKIDLKEISNFSYDILKSLLRCNKSKSEAIKPEIDFEDQIDGLLIIADELRLKQIMLNLISNAVKFTKSGRIRIRCSIVAVKHFVLVCISDTGIGIPESEQGKLFNDFKMIKTDSVDNAMGSGLGLSICKSLASSMNIQISTTSEYGKGSEFSLAIPFMPQISIIEPVNIFFEGNYPEADQENEINLKEIKASYSNRLVSYKLTNYLAQDSKNKTSKDESQLNNIESSGINSNINSARTVKIPMNQFIIRDFNIQGLNLTNNTHSPRSSNTFRKESNPSSISIISEIIEEKEKEKILIVDDNYFNSEATMNILKKVLKEYGSEMEIILGSDGADIIEYMINDQSNGHEIKLIITDENMEYLNGSEAIRIIRNLERRNKVQPVNIISVTGNEESQCKSEILKAGAQLVFSKPIQKTLLTSALKELNII